jgi:hypothetical protein
LGIHPKSTYTTIHRQQQLLRLQYLPTSTHFGMAQIHFVGRQPTANPAGHTRSAARQLLPTNVLKQLTISAFNKMGQDRAVRLSILHFDLSRLSYRYSLLFISSHYLFDLKHRFFPLSPL